MDPIVSSVFRIISARVPCQTSVGFRPTACPPIGKPYNYTSRYGKAIGETGMRLNCSVTPSALTTVADDERLFRDSVYEFADREIRPLVRSMDDEAKIPRALVDRLFALGVMGIEIPDEHAGG